MDSGEQSEGSFSIPENVPPLDPDKFLDALHHAYKAVVFPGSPFPDPKERALFFKDKKTVKMLFDDSSFNRASFAIIEKYRDDQFFAKIFLARYYSLYQVFEDHRFLEWTRVDEEGFDVVSETIFHAIAIAPLNGVNYDLDSLFALAEELESQR